MIRPEQISLTQLPDDAREYDRRLLQDLYDQFRDVGARLGAIEATIGTVPRRSKTLGYATSPLTTKGDLWGYSTLDARLPVGTNAHVLTADSTQTLGVKWAAAGTVTSVSVTTANGVSGSVATATTTPAITLTLGAITPTKVTIAEAVGASGLIVTGATQTTSQPAIDATQTWNAGAVTFTGWKLNVTNTASAAASKLLDLQVGGTTQFSVTRLGDANVLGDVTVGGASFLLKSNNTLPDGAGAGAGTLGNAPTAGNPSKWVAISDNGTTRWIPTWV